jgi:hypothetical protein
MLATGIDRAAQIGPVDRQCGDCHVATFNAKGSRKMQFDQKVPMHLSELRYGLVWTSQ